MPAFHGSLSTCVKPSGPACGQCTVSGTARSSVENVRVPRTTTEWREGRADWRPTVAGPPVEPAPLPPPRPHPAATAAKVTVSPTLRHICERTVHAGRCRPAGPGDGYGPAGEQPTSLPPAHRRGATGDLAGVVRRPRVRVRGDAAQPPAAAPPDAARRSADAVPVAGRVVGLDLHHLDDQLVRSRFGAGATGAPGGDGIQPVDGGRHPGGLRQPGAAVRLLLRPAAGRTKRLQRLRHTA